MSRDVRVRLSEEEAEALAREAQWRRVPQGELLRAAYFQVEPRAFRPRAPSLEVGPFRCELCVARPLGNIDSLGAHVRRKHGMPMAEYRRTFGDPDVLSLDEAAELKATVPDYRRRQ